MFANWALSRVVTSFLEVLRVNSSFLKLAQFASVKNIKIHEPISHNFHFCHLWIFQYKKCHILLTGMRSQNTSLYWNASQLSNMLTLINFRHVCYLSQIRTILIVFEKDRLDPISRDDEDIVSDQCCQCRNDEHF